MRTIKVNPTEIKIIPTKKKFENAQKFAQKVSGESGLPKGEPVDKKIYIVSMKEEFERIKESIRANIDRMKGL